LKLRVHGIGGSFLLGQADRIAPSRTVDRCRMRAVIPDNADSGLRYVSQCGLSSSFPVRARKRNLAHGERIFRLAGPRDEANGAIDSVRRVFPSTMRRSPYSSARSAAPTKPPGPPVPVTFRAILRPGPKCPHRPEKGSWIAFLAHLASEPPALCGETEQPPRRTARCSEHFPAHSSSPPRLTGPC
jgi:hypothetical protein